MKRVELYAQVRRAVYVEGISQREAARRFGIDPRTVAKMLAFSVPPGYRRSRPPARPKLDPFVGIIDRILEEDKSQPAKQQHTAKRIFERLRAEHGYDGGVSIVRGYVHEHRQRRREMFVPLRHDRGHAQVDFGEALAVLAGAECKIHFFAMDLPHSDACLVQAYPAESSEAFCAGHLQSFEFFGGVPRSILYDNLKLAVARILEDGTRQRTRIFSELQSHYLFADRFGRPGKGNDKGKVEGLVGYTRRNFMVPIPRAASFAELNAQLLECCRRRLNDRLRGHDETIGERLARDREALLRLPPAPYEACEKKPARVSSLSLVRYRGNDYSVPTAYGHREVLVRGYVHEVVIACAGEEIARHARSYAHEDFVFNPLHYLALLNARSARSTRPRRWSDGNSPRSPPPCAGCSKRAWANAASASSSRCCAYSKSLLLKTWAPELAKRSRAELSASMRSSTWCCAASNGVRRASTSRFTHTFRKPQWRPPRPAAT